MMEIVHCFGLAGLAGVSIEGEEFRQQKRAGSQILLGDVAQ